MGEVVPDQLEGVLFVPRRYQGKISIAFERAVDVAKLAIDPRRQRRLGLARPDRRRDIRRRRPLGHFAHGAIGKLDLEHFGHAVST
jgi:hypothetical protein